MVNPWFHRPTCIALAVLLALLAAACTFDVSGIPVDKDAISACTPDASYCDDHVLMTCDATGSGPVDDGTPCAFICHEDENAGTAQCLYASNVPTEVYDACPHESGVALAPTVGTVTIAEPEDNMLELQCSDGCGNSVRSILPVHVVEDRAAWFCLSRVDIPAGIVVSPMGSIRESIIWLVDGDVNIAGAVSVNGHPATMSLGGIGGPGGYDGYDRTYGVGHKGLGPCPGRGGARVAYSAAGGGGGAGFGGIGGAGGVGSNLFGDTATGGNGGGVCGSEALVPLIGGSSGGTGANGVVGNYCGWPSGGGGGALGISARGAIEITGSLAAIGGGGYGESPNLGGGCGGGGGGGAGGALLLEARTLSVSTTGILPLVVDGGNGGPSAAGDGGAGATTEQFDDGNVNGGNGTDSMAPGDGGSGGGGGAGRIRLNTPDGSFACGDFASPKAACTSGSLWPTIKPLSDP